MNPGLTLTIDEPSQAGEARRKALGLAAELGLDETEAGRLAIVVTEMATNLVKHARGGNLLLRPVGEASAPSIEVLALDKGPGIANVGESLRDGHSTTGSPGTGLGAIRRLSGRADIYSQAGVGTAVLARVGRDAAPAGRRLEIGAVCVPSRGEEICGDDWAAEEREGRSKLLVVDGLGHGILAAEAGEQAVRAFRQRAAEAPRAILEAIHGALRSTRGAAVAVAEVDHASGHLRYSGVGNICGVLLTASGARHLMSQNGTVGHQVRRIDEFTYAWPADAVLVLHSDGLGSRWDIGRYPGLGLRHPTLIAGVLYRDFTRDRDDVTVVVARERRA